MATFILKLIILKLYFMSIPEKPVRLVQIHIYTAATLDYFTKALMASLQQTQIEQCRRLYFRESQEIASL